MLETQYVSVVVVYGVGKGGVEVHWTVYLVAYFVPDIRPDRGSPCQIDTGSACFLGQPRCEVTLCAMTQCHMDEWGAAPETAVW